MTSKARIAKLRQEAAVRNLSFVCLLALAAILVALLLRGPNLLTLLLVVIGAGGIAVPWRSAPLLLLVLLTVEYLNLWSRGPRGRGPWFMDLALCAAILGYASAHYRLQGLLLDIVPPDPRKRSELPPVRSARLVGPRELVWLLIALPIWVGLAHLAVGLFPAAPAGLELPPNVWRTLVLAWTIGSVMLVGAGLLGYLGQRALSRAEAAVFVQDQFWRETRGEQRRLQRWLAWARLRKRRQEQR